MTTRAAPNCGGRRSKQLMAMASTFAASDRRNETTIFRFLCHVTTSSRATMTMRYASSSFSSASGSSHGHSSTRSSLLPGLWRQNSTELPASKDWVSDGKDDGTLLSGRRRPLDSTTSLKKLSAPSASLSNLCSGAVAQLVFFFSAAAERNKSFGRMDQVLRKRGGACGAALQGFLLVHM